MSTLYTDVRVKLHDKQMPVSMSNMQVKRAHTVEKSYMQICSPVSTGALWYLHGINHCIIGLSTRYNLSCILLASLYF